MDLQELPNAKPVSPQYARDEDWLDAHLGELVRRYPDKWIAVVNENIVAIGADMGEVGRRAKELHPDAEPVIWLLEGKPRVYAHCAALS